LVGLVLLAQRLLRRRLAPAWRYGLWLLVIARLLMPVVPASGFSIFNLVSLNFSRQHAAAWLTQALDTNPQPPVNYIPSIGTTESVHSAQGSATILDSS